MAVRYPAARHPVLALVVALAMAAATSGLGACTQADTLVSVRVRGSTAGLRQLLVTLSVAGKLRTLSVPQMPQPIVLPTSFTVQMDRSLQGRLQVSIEGQDEAGGTIARGNSAIPNLVVGQTNQVQVDLTGTDGGPGPDGGVSDAGGAGSDADAPGGTGGAGTGGAGTGAGTGGAAGAGDTGTGGGGAGGMGNGGAGTGGAETGGAGTGGGGPGGMGMAGAGGGLGGTASGGAGFSGAGTGGAGTGGAATGGAGAGGAGGAGGADDVGVD